MQAILTKVENGLPPDVAELCSPPRTSLGAQQFGLAPGVAMDLRTGWDFTLHRHRQAALEYVRRVKPLLIIVSPECTQLRQLQHLDGRVWNARGAELLKEAKGQQTYREQKKQGWFFPARTPFNSKFVADARGTYVVTREGAISKMDRGVAHEDDDSSNKLEHTWHGMMSLEHFLDPREAKRARLKEIEYVRSKRVSTAK